MLRSVPLSHLLLVAGAALLLSGCPDPPGVIDGFVDRTNNCADRPPPGDVPVVSRTDATGAFLLAIAADIDSSKPLLFNAVVNLDTTGEPWTMSMELQPLIVADRTPVEPFWETGDIEIGGFGTFDADFGEIVINGAADPIIPGAEVTATLALHGVIGVTEEAGMAGDVAFDAGTRVLCGTVSGQITAPANVPLTGTFASVAIESESSLMEMQVVDKCPLPEGEKEECKIDRG